MTGRPAPVLRRASRAYATNDSDTRREGWITFPPCSDGVRLFYRLEGSAPASLVFVQGGPGGDLREAAPDFEALAQGRTVIHYDHRGGPLEGAREWAAALPDGRLLVLPGVAHYPQLESPVHFFSAVEAFLAGRWPSGAVAVPQTTTSAAPQTCRGSCCTPGGRGLPAHRRAHTARGAC